MASVTLGRSPPGQSLDYVVLPARGPGWEGPQREAPRDHLSLCGTGIRPWHSSSPGTGAQETLLVGTAHMPAGPERRGWRCRSPRAGVWDRAVAKAKVSAASPPPPPPCLENLVCVSAPRRRPGSGRLMTASFSSSFFCMKWTFPSMSCGAWSPSSASAHSLGAAGLRSSRQGCDHRGTER